MQKHIYLVHAALDLRQGHEYEQAANLLEQAIKLEPDYIPSYIYLGLVYQDWKEPAKAEAAFRQALHREPENPEALQCLGMLYLGQERYTEAIVNLEKHLQLEPENENSLEILVPLLVQVDRLDDAKRYLRAAWQKTKDKRDAIRYARTLIGWEEFDAAYQFLNEALQVSENANLFIELALVLVIQTKYDEAIQALKKALALRPDYDRALRGLAHCYTQLNQADTALEFAEKALAIGPRHYRNWQAKADALLLAERYDDALTASQMGIDLIDPEDMEAKPVLVVLYLQRVNAYRAKNEIDAALAELAQARKTLPDEEVFYMRAVQLCMQQDCVDDALAVIEEALEAELPPAEKWISLGYQLLIHAGQSERAFKFWQEKSAKYPGAFDALAGVGVDLYTKGEVGKARIIFEQLLSQSPNDVRLRINLGYILIGEGAFEQARTYLNATLGIGAEPDAADNQHIARCNLGYLDLLERRWQDASQHLSAVVEMAPGDETAYLRVAFWWDDQIVPDYAPHPVRSLPLRAAALANLVTLALAQGDNRQAQGWVSKLRDAYPTLPVVGEILGTIYHALGDHPHARQALTMAREGVDDPQEQQMIDSWLSLSG